MQIVHFGYPVVGDAFHFLLNGIQYLLERVGGVAFTYSTTLTVGLHIKTSQTWCCEYILCPEKTVPDRSVTHKLYGSMKALSD